METKNTESLDFLDFLIANTNMYFFDCYRNDYIETEVIGTTKSRIFLWYVLVLLVHLIKYLALNKYEQSALSTFISLISINSF